MNTKDQMETSPGVAGVANLAIIATIEIVPGRKEQLLPLLLAHKDRCLADEPGTLQFEVLAPHDDDSKLLVYEVYQDAPAFDAHRNGASIAQFRKESAGMVEKLYITKCARVD